MKVYLQHKRLRMVLPVPTWILRLMSKAAIKNSIIKHTPREYIKYVESMDFNEVDKAVEILKQYKGMDIVNVESNDGTKVRIRL
ncbi:hypothetical protein GOM49_16180 [Clostridium bovifaecis]|uniref:Uncharacterized protein n=1 Tax=Clostridium bovifaecis TaxID=2184719 RepID=A0A6I6ES32_9CLOT|nr:hypothetical protein GOM49_16180 [Clostridium bovifaecis]